MPIVTTALVNLLVVLVIGIAVGVGFARSGTSYLGRARDSLSGVGVGTYALIGVAGSFMGFHLGVLLGLLPQPLMLFLMALVGALITVWIWRR
ncbi:MAG: transglycosylase [Hyphomicrobiaceae bacterium]